MEGFLAVIGPLVILAALIGVLLFALVRSAKDNREHEVREEIEDAEAETRKDILRRRRERVGKLLHELQKRRGSS